MKQQGFTLIETMVGISLLAMMVAFTTQMQLQFARSISSQEQAGCLSERVKQTYKRLQNLRPLNEIEGEMVCPSSRAKTQVAVQVLSGGYAQTETPALAVGSPCADLKVVVKLNQQERFQGDFYACNF
jgi:prepilin-type N-terminal cleavage/methylation domain-containing protein